MNRSFLIGVTVTVVVALAWQPATHVLGHQQTPTAPVSSKSPRRPSVRDQDIAFYEARVKRDRYGARDRAALGALYLARAREQGGEADYARAEALARESYRLRGRRNGDALSILVGSLLAQHKFLAAWDEAARLVSIDPTPVASATMGEIALELGRYHAADSLFRSLSVQQRSSAIAPRYARWLELSGQSGAARTLLERARARMAGEFRVPPEQLAWYDLRIGDLAFRNGRGDLAEAAYRRGLALHPGDARLLTALGTLRGGQGRWAEALELGGEALTILFDPATLGLMSRAALALGDSAQADEYARGAEVAVSRQPGAFHRGWALFLLDQGRQVPEILQRAQADLVQRRDVYGFDLTAWALYRSGRPREAMALADSALGRGVRDATLHYHAGRIAAALGDSTRAHTESMTALEISSLAVTFQEGHR